MSNPNDPQGPPDLEAFFKKLFGGGEKKSTRRPNPFQQNPQKPEGNSISMRFWLIIAAVLAVVLFVASGFFKPIVGEQGVVFRFGQYNRTVNEGLHWSIPLVEHHYIFNIAKIRSATLSSKMITSDENFVNVNTTVQYRISNIKDYLFKVADPKDSLEKQIFNSAVRQVVGISDLDFILTTGRAKVTDQIRQVMNRLVDRYGLGVEIVDVTKIRSTAPTEVQKAFDDVIKAREENQQMQNEAQSYANRLLPKANGESVKLLQQAEAYKDQVSLLAKGQTAVFDAVLPIYKASPKVTHDRMYLDAMNQVLANNKIVLVPAGKGNQNLYYVPLDKLNQSAPNAANNAASSTVVHTAVNNQSKDSTQTLNQQQLDRMKRYMRYRGNSNV